MECTTKNNALKVFRVAVFSKINYYSIEYIRIVYKSKIFTKIFLHYFSTSTIFQHSD